MTGREKEKEKETGREKEWDDYGHYYISKSPQQSAEWKRQRIEGMSKTKLPFVTASRFAIAARGTRFMTQHKLAKILVGAEKEEYSAQSLIDMEKGTVFEPHIRDHYARYEIKKEVHSIGLAISKDNPHLGASVDGVVDDGIIEIKTTKHLYKDLQVKIQQNKAGKKFDKFYHQHIFQSHYDQMHGGMAILGKKWCDYIVYAYEDKIMYIERIWFNAEYWRKLKADIEVFLTDVASGKYR